MVSILSCPLLGFSNLVTLFQGFTFLVEKKVKNEIKNVFIHDNSNVLKNLTSGEFKKKTTTIIAKEGIVDEKRWFYLMVKFYQLKKMTLVVMLLSLNN